jgi:hypothetical protein
MFSRDGIDSRLVLVFTFLEFFVFAFGKREKECDETIRVQVNEMETEPGAFGVAGASQEDHVDCTSDSSEELHDLCHGQVFGRFDFDLGRDCFHKEIHVHDCVYERIEQHDEK